MEKILPMVFSSDNDILGIGALLFLIFTIIIYFREPIKALLSSIPLRKTKPIDKCSDCNRVIEQFKKDICSIVNESNNNLEKSISEISESLFNKNKNDGINEIQLANTLNNIIKDLERGIGQMRSDIEKLSKQISDDSKRDIIIDSNIEHIVAKLDNFSSALIEISFKLEFMSKRNVGF